MNELKIKGFSEITENEMDVINGGFEPIVTITGAAAGVAAAIGFTVAGVYAIGNIFKWW